MKFSCFFIRNKQQFRNVLPHFLQYLDVRVRSHTQVWHKKTVFWERVSETIEFIDKELSYCVAITTFDQVQEVAT